MDHTYDCTHGFILNNSNLNTYKLTHKSYMYLKSNMHNTIVKDWFAVSQEFTKQAHTHWKGG